MTTWKKRKTKVLIEVWFIFVFPTAFLCDNRVLFFFFSCSARYEPHLEHIKACQGRIFILYHVRVATGLPGHLSAEVHHSAGCGARMNRGARVCTQNHTQTSTQAALRERCWEWGFSLFNTHSHTGTAELESNLAASCLEVIEKTAQLNCKLTSYWLDISLWEAPILAWCIASINASPRVYDVHFLNWVP